MKLKRFTFGFMSLFIMLTSMQQTVMAEQTSHHKHKHHSSSDRECHRKNKRHCKTCAPKVISHPTIITKSGAYCLSKDIFGTIVVAASDVTINLNSHRVSGNGQTPAILVQNQFNVKIKNGSVSNASGLGIQVVGSTGFSLKNVQIFGTNNALAMTETFASELNNVKVYDNLNVSDALLLIDTCESIKLSNVEVINNTKNLTVPVGTNEPGNALLYVVNSLNISSEGVLINNNAKTGGDSRFAPILILASSNVVATNGQLNGNAVLVDDATRFQPFVIFDSSDIVIDGYQINGNSAQKCSAFRGILAQDSPRVVIKNTQINDNTHQAAPDGPDGFISDRGIYLAAFSLPMDGCVVSNCQICRNTIVNGTIETPAGFSEFEGIRVTSAIADPQSFNVPTIIENCQINYNSIGGAGELGQFIAGIMIDSTDACIVRDCQCDYNNGGFWCSGIIVIGQPDLNLVSGKSKNAKVINCTGNNNTSNGPFAAGLAVCGLTLAPDFTDFVQNLQVIGGQFNFNFGAERGYGIALQDTIGCSVEKCQTDANMTTGVFLGRFIFDDLLGDNPHPINADTTIVDCSAKENLVNGFELNGIFATNYNCLLQSNVALTNGGIGFLDTSVSLTSRYLSNFSKGNAILPYSFADGAIQIFSLDKFGNYVHFSGDAVHFSELVNIQEPIVP